MKETRQLPKILIAGSTGRMARGLLELVESDESIECLGGTGRESDRELIARADVLVDFTTPAFTENLITACRETGTRMVIGTTGLAPAQYAAMRAAACEIAICYSANYSIGVNLLYKLAAEAAAALEARFDIEVVEAHHRDKKDAPSGTALALGGHLARARGVEMDEVAVYSRHGLTGERIPGSIGFQSIRGGDVAGEHTVYFLGDGERLELTHRAGNREIFARGALRAAKKISLKDSGLYEFLDLI